MGTFFYTPHPSLSPQGARVYTYESNAMKNWVTIFLILLLFLSGCSTVPRSFHPQQPIEPQQFSHNVFNGALKDHVSDGVVKYPSLSRDSRLNVYLDQLNRVDPNALPTRSKRLAFWINTYNAFAIKGILDGYSPRTKIGQYRYFIEREYMVGGEALNLNNLEKKILIKNFREPRIHFAIVCASQSCPRTITGRFVWVTHWGPRD